VRAVFREAVHLCALQTGGLSLLERILPHLDDMTEIVMGTTNAILAEWASSERSPNQEVPPAVHLTAIELLPVCALVAYSRAAPKSFVDRMSRIAADLQPPNIPPWQHALEQVFQTGIGFSADPFEAARQVRWMLLRRLTHAPAQFRDPPSPLVIRKAARVLRELLRGSPIPGQRMRELRLARGRMKAGGGLPSPWGAARRFADAFGLKMPKKSAVERYSSHRTTA
jgi:hypothetical protein